MDNLNICTVCECLLFSKKQRFKIIDFLMGPWDPLAMILIGPRTLGMSPIIDLMFLFIENFKTCPQDAGS